jgi:WD40 repeat protein
MTLTGLSRSPPDEACPPDAIITGRDWLLSGSRDRTLRLWTLNGVRPKVVKIFHGGHEGSILLNVPQTYPPVSPSRYCYETFPASMPSPGTLRSVLCVRGNTRHIVTCSKGELVAAVGSVGAKAARPIDQALPLARFEGGTCDSTRHRTGRPWGGQRGGIV